MKKLPQRLRRLLSRRTFIVLLILAQLALLIALFMRYHHLRWVAISLNVISVITALHLLTRPDKNAFKLSLIFLILLVPLFGGALYWIFHFQTASVGFRRTLETIGDKARAWARETETAHSEAKLTEATEALPEHAKQIRYLQNVTGFPIYKNTEVRYFSHGMPMLEALLEDLESARRFIFLEYFIIEEGRMWNAILEVLERKAQEGLDVRVVFDDLGCILTLPPDCSKRLREKGIQCQPFNKFHPFLTNLQNNRDHRKIAVIDGRVAYTGGINLADEYIGERIKHGVWKDSAVRLCGDGARSLTVMFLQIFGMLNRKEETYADYLGTESSSDTVGWVQPYSDSPIDREPVGEQVYLHMIQGARKYLYITTPYLMVDDNLLSALKISAKSGVDVRIITPGIPDKKTVHFTTRSYYQELIAAGVRIYEYAEGFMHSKTFVSDDSVATVGTTNLDFRSLYLHFECGVCLYGSEAVAEVKKDFLSTLPLCREITQADCKAGLLKRLFQCICRIFAPLM